MKPWLFVLLNFLGLAGAVLVIVVLCAMALGKWKSIAFRTLFWFALLGTAIPILLYLTWVYTSTHGLLNAEITIQSFFLVLWPSSLGLMGLQGKDIKASELLTFSVLILMNTGLYGIVGLFVGSAWQRFRRNHQGEK